MSVELCVGFVLLTVCLAAILGTALWKTGYRAGMTWVNNQTGRAYRDGLITKARFDLRECPRCGRRPCLFDGDDHYSLEHRCNTGDCIPIVVSAEWKNVGELASQWHQYVDAMQLDKGDKEPGENR